MRSSDTTRSLSLKCSFISHGKSVFVMAKKKKLVNMLPSIAPIIPAAKKIGITDSTRVVTVTIAKLRVTADRIKTGRPGCIRVIVSTWERKRMLQRR